MTKISCRQFNKIKSKHRNSLLIAFSFCFFILVIYLNASFLSENLFKKIEKTFLLNEFLFTHKFAIFIFFNSVAACILCISLRPTFSIDKAGIYIKPGLIYSSYAYFIPWESVENIEKCNGADDDGMQYKMISVSTKLDSSKLTKFKISLFYGVVYFKEKFSFTISFYTNFYQDRWFKKISDQLAKH